MFFLRNLTKVRGALETEKLVKNSWILIKDKLPNCSTMPVDEYG